MVVEARNMTEPSLKGQSSLFYSWEGTGKVQSWTQGTVKSWNHDRLYLTILDHLQGLKIPTATLPSQRQAVVILHCFKGDRTGSECPFAQDGSQGKIIHDV